MKDPETELDPPGSRGLASGSSGYAVLQNRDFMLYLIGRFVAVIGQQAVLQTAIGWELFERTGWPLSVGLIGLTQVVPMFCLTLPAGHLADNHDRKRIIVLTASVIAATNLGLALISAWSAPIVWMYLCLFVIGAAQTFLAAAVASFLPQLVERKEFSRAVTWNSGTFQLASIIGPAAAGGLIVLAHQHAWPVYAFNALATAIFCVLISSIRHQHEVAARERMTLKSLLTGFDFVFGSRIILGIITLDMFAVLLGGATALMPIYAKVILHVGPGGLGCLVAALPLGAVVCTFYLAHRRPLQKAGRALLWSVTAFGLATIVFGFSRWFALSLVMLFMCGAVDNISVVVRHTLVQMLTPDEKRGRVSAVNNLFIGSSNQLGEFESGLVAQVFGPTLGNTVAAGAIIAAVSGGVGTVLVVAAVALIWPEIRKFGRLDAF